MKNKYITTQILLTCLSHKNKRGQDIHARLQETLAERKQLLKELQKLLRPEIPAIQRDIHAQLAETIAERKRLIREAEMVLEVRRRNLISIKTQKAA